MILTLAVYLAVNTATTFGGEYKPIVYKKEYVGCKLKDLRKQKRNACFYRYIAYSGRYRLLPSSGQFTGHLTLLHNGQPYHRTDTLTMMHGIYELVDDQGRLYTHEEYKNGRLQVERNYDGRTNTLVSVLDFTKRYENQEGSYFVDSNEGEQSMVAYFAVRDGKWQWIPVPK